MECEDCWVTLWEVCGYEKGVEFVYHRDGTWETFQRVRMCIVDLLALDETRGVLFVHMCDEVDVGVRQS